MAQDKQGYIPPSIQRQMDQHMQHMPANLQKYAGGNTYIPQKAAQEMSSYMQKTMPAHMKEYINPYMHQQTTAGLNSLDPVSSRTMQERAPTVNLMRRDHSAFGEQFSVDTNNSTNNGSLSFSPQYSPQGTPSPAPPPAPMPTGNQNPYDFIMNEQPKKGGFLSGGSQKQRMLIVAIGTLILITIALLFFALLSSSGKSSTQTLVSIAQEQNEIIRVADMGVSQGRTSEARNLATVTAMSFRSSQNETLALLKKQGHKLGTKQLALKQDSNTDSQLNTAALNNNFDSAFIKIMDGELMKYQKDVKSAYDNSSNKTEKQTLATSYNGVNLLLSTQTAASQ